MHLSALRVADGAASSKLASGTQLQLTPLGRAMAAFPITPRHSRMLLEAACPMADPLAPPGSAATLDALPHALALAAALSSESPFVHADAVGPEAAPAAAPRDTDAEVSAEQARISADQQRARDRSQQAVRRPSSQAPCIICWAHACRQWGTPCVSRTRLTTYAPPDVVRVPTYR